MNGGGRSDAMDIDSDPSAAGFGRASSSTLVDLAHNIPDRAQETDVQRLMRAWQNERHAPDILPMEEGALGRVLDAVRRQVCASNHWKGVDSDEIFLCSLLMDAFVCSC